LSAPDELTDDDFNDIDALDVDLMLADEAHDDLRITPVFCLVHGHNFNARGFCLKCGHDSVLELAFNCLARAG
jgi:hypothetical protein